MKIAQVCPYDIDRPGGVQMHIRDTAATLMEAGHEVVIVAPKVEGAPPRQAIWQQARELDIVRVGSARKISFGATGYEISMARGAELDALDALMRKGRFDVVHFHTMWTPLLPYQIFTRSRAANVATFHDTAAKTLSGAVLRALFRTISRRLLPRLEGVIAVSEAPLEHLRAPDDVKVHIVPLCTDLRRFANGENLSRRFEDGRVNILFIGRIEKRKGISLLLKAYRRLCAEGLPVRLIVAGGGEGEAALRRSVERHRVPAVVFTGEFSLAETPRWFAEADIVCAPSPYGESFGIVVAEAMASGKSVVAAANAGYRALLASEAVHCLVTPGDAVALYRGLRAQVQDADLRRRLGAWGRKKAMRYDCREVAPQLLAIYEQAIVKAKSKGR